MWLRCVPISPCPHGVLGDTGQHPTCSGGGGFGCIPIPGLLLTS